MLSKGGGTRPGGASTVGNKHVNVVGTALCTVLLLMVWSHSRVLHVLALLQKPLCSHWGDRLLGAFLKPGVCSAVGKQDSDSEVRLPRG